MTPELVRLEELLAEVLEKYLPGARGSISELTRGVIDRAGRERIAHAIARELIDTGLGPNDEPTDRGVELERLLDEINRPNLER
jgi:hypothetical protein